MSRGITLLSRGAASALLLAPLTSAGAAGSQADSTPPSSGGVHRTPETTSAASRVPEEVLHGEPGRWHFAPGERAVYAVTFGPVRVGEGRLAVEAVELVRGTPAYRVAFELEGGPFFYKIDDRQVSWVAPQPLRSLRFEQRLRQGGYRRDRRYVLDHEACTYSRFDLERSTGEYRPHGEEIDVPMPPAALDEIAYLYLARLLPLEPGRRWRFERYFEPDGNPVVIEVLRRQTVRVPAGRFETVVVRPVIKASGMFGEDGRAEVYISDDEHRIIVRLSARMKAGEMEMFLTGYDPGDPAALIPIPAGPVPSEPAPSPPISSTPPAGAGG